MDSRRALFPDTDGDGWRLGKFTRPPGLAVPTFTTNVKVGQPR